MKVKYNALSRMTLEQFCDKYSLTLTIDEQIDGYIASLDNIAVGNACPGLKSKGRTINEAIRCLINILAIEYMTVYVYSTDSDGRINEKQISIPPTIITTFNDYNFPDKQ